jgi:hypothetical protein
MYAGLRVNVCYFCLIFYQNRSGSTYYNEKSQVQNLTKIRPVVVAVFHADGRTDRRDMTRLIIRFLCTFTTLQISEISNHSPVTSGWVTDAVEIASRISPLGRTQLLLLHFIVIAVYLPFRDLFTA